MGFEVGAVLEGKITGITKFGAFVALPEGKSGLVHISEVANTYVSDVNAHLSVGQQVKVRILNIAEDGKINLSIKRAEAEFRENRGRGGQGSPNKNEGRAAIRPSVRSTETTADGDDFEDRLKKFMRESDSRIADNRMYSERRQKSRRR